MRHGSSERVADSLGGPAAQSDLNGAELYVAVNGNDDWTGGIDTPSSAGTDGPLASLDSARDRVRRMRQDAPSVPVTVHVREGTYFLPKPLTFGPEDSGSAAAPVVYAAYPGERPVLSVGKRITDWRTAEVNGRTVWTAQLPELGGPARRLRQLFVDGERRRCAGHPNDGWLYVDALPDVTDETPWSEGQSRFRFAAGDLHAWDDANEGEIVALHFWVDSHLPIKAIDEEERLISFTKRSIFRLTGDHSHSGAAYYVENVLSALDEPGEWCFHRKTGTLYYLPHPHEVAETTEVIVGGDTVVVSFEGDPAHGRWVSHVALRGLTLSHAGWWFGADYEPAWPHPDIGGMVQAAFAVPGAVSMHGARDCALDRCAITQVGTYAVELGRGCRHNVVRHCEMTDLGAGGVKIGETEAREAAGDQTHGNVVTDNVIRGGGRLFHSAVGIWVGHSGGNLLAHNGISDLYYTGISVGWSWGYGHSLSAHNRIEHNHIHTIGQGWLSDMGGIYTLGVSPGMLIRNNLIHDISSRGYGGWGIDLDEGTSHAVVEKNIVFRTNRAGFHLHYGKDNLITNNVFAFGGEAQITRTRPDPFVFRRNIVYWDHGEFLTGNWSELNVTMDENVYFNSEGDPIEPNGGSWGAWQASGMDVHSVVADPLFVAPREGDFRLNPDSPALRVGFQAIDVKCVGPRAE